VYDEIKFLFAVSYAILLPEKIGVLGQAKGEGFHASVPVVKL
jgi:hypothetical protein